MENRTYVIGRAGDIRLYDHTVSRRHARLEVEGDRIYLEDLDSHNGTYEVREKKVHRFSAGIVTLDQVFAFGECVRSIGQLLKTAELEAALANTAAGALLEGTSNPLASTQEGSALTPRKRLSSADVIQMLERAEDEIALGRDVSDVCTELGISVGRYERWCKEYGDTREERQRAVVALSRENERLRKRLEELMRRRQADEDASPPPAAAPASGTRAEDDH